ncbi:protein osm- isoform a [Chrysochromulina tobinii]|uniref:Protein osm-isoform a n=1 Tax=Chrysochromulina tobinii TaxID=1460289 RepID=A0A0M0J672_9EUKA|nr:protein osm- isoform a [Chrysochromulina tobinii]|eukprot:KOO22096.1 protein osm- isoform a [Chrysochromulina sp. CCMP291]
MQQAQAKRPPRAPSPAANVSPLRRVTSAPTKAGSKLRPPASRSRSPGGAADVMASGDFSGENRRRSSSFGSRSGSPSAGGFGVTPGRPRRSNSPESTGQPLARSRSPVASPLALLDESGGASAPRTASRASSPPASCGFRQSSVRVAVRVRPSGNAHESAAVSVSGRTVTLTGGPLTHHYGKPGEGKDDAQVFAYDHAFGPSADQLSVFAACGAPLVKEILEGFNATIFAYGQTGSGKTHTMLGTALEPGLVPRSAYFLFERLQAMRARDASKVRADEAATPRAAKSSDDEGDEEEDAGGGEGGGEEAADVIDLISRGNGQRATAATKMNAASSRSHAVFTLVLEQQVPVDEDEAGEAGEALAADADEDADTAATDEGIVPTEESEAGATLSSGGSSATASRRRARRSMRTLRSKLNLVDLAGSERAKLSGADEDKKMMSECVAINKSLAALGNVIAALSGGRATHVPYRESKLTQLLEESLGGNAQTVMINAVSPHSSHYAETLSTLQWAKRAQSIVNVSVQGEAVDASAASEQMAAMAKLQKQALAEAAQQSRERQIEMQSELDQMRAEVQRATADAAAAREEAKAARKQLKQQVEEVRRAAREQSEHELAISKGEMHAEQQQAIAQAIAAKELEWKRQLAEAESASTHLASARANQLHIASELAAAAERETKLQLSLKTLVASHTAVKATLESEREKRKEAEAHAKQARDAARAASEAEASELDAAMAKAREAANERVEALKAETEKRISQVRQKAEARVAEAEARLMAATEAATAAQAAMRSVEAQKARAAAEEAAALAAKQEALATVAAAEARSAVSSQHRQALEAQVLQAAAAADGLKVEAAASKAQAASLAATNTALAAANQALEAQQEAARAARDDALDAAAAATASKEDLQAEISNLRAEVSRSRDAVAQAMMSVHVTSEAEAESARHSAQHGGRGGKGSEEPGKDSPNLLSNVFRRAAEGSSAGLGESPSMATPAPETQHHISSCMTTDEIKARCADASIDFIQPGPGCYPHAWTLA